MNVEELCKKSIEEHNIMSLVDKLGHLRRVEPHIIFEKNGEKNVGYYYLSGFDQKENTDPHWDSMKLSEFEDGEILGEHFDKRNDFDPFSAKYGDVIEFVK